MAKYKILRDEWTNEVSMILEPLSGGVKCIPLSENNPEYKEYLQWIDEGNIPDDPDKE